VVTDREEEDVERLVPAPEKVTFLFFNRVLKYVKDPSVV